MTLTEFKKVANLLKQAYREVEAEALTAGIDLMSEEYDQLIAKTRELVITSSGFTVEDFDQLKTKINSTSKVGMYDYMQKVNSKIKNLEDRHVPNADEIKQIATEVAMEVVKQNYKAPEIINQIVKETTIEKPQIIKETTIEKVVDTRNYDDSRLKQELATVNKRLNSLPAPYDDSQLRKDIKGYFNESFEYNINILGMPDFRKLAMGLQAQIDALSGSSSGGGFTELPATGTVDGNNTSFTFTQKPTYIVSDHAWYKENKGWTWAGSTATMTIPPNDDIYGVA